MNKEVKETIKILQNNSLVKSGSYEFIGDSDITYAEIYILLKFIEDLQQENKQIKIQISAREEVCYRLEEENKKYKNQQKEFIKWLEDYLNLFDYRNIEEQAGYDMLEEILQKYKEIIGGKDER